jgi:hypothetical protein
MISETFLYGTRDSVFAGILQQVAAIAGRYHVSPNYGHDINTNNLQQFFKDNKHGLVSPDQKYPLAVLITPVSTVINLNGNDWEHFAFSLFFLQQSFTQQIDSDTNVSAQPVYEDWSQMKDAAIQFKNLLKATLKGQVTIQEQQYPFSLYVNADFEKIYIRRLSNFSNDNISGVELGFNLLLNINECEIILDGDVHYVVSQLLDEVDPLWNIEKQNYFTKNEVQALFDSISTEGSESNALAYAIALG